MFASLALNLNPTRSSDPRSEIKTKSRIKIKNRFAIQSAFTLIELMVVVGIIGIILGIAVPGIYRQLHPNPLQKAVDDIREACKAAHEMAVLRSATTSLSIDLKSRSFSLQGASAPGPETGMSPEGPAAFSRVADVGSSAKGSFQLSDRVIIEGLGINGLDWTEDERAEVRFYPKGTSDEFSIVLRWVDNGELRNIWLDAITSYAEFEVDPNKFRHR